ncbi:hypothetical protein TSL6_13540 [Sulfurovum sp. TSL6]|nr:hypothetical protein TSL6_13540 [Sulfurovum sp. TSL6]
MLFSRSKKFTTSIYYEVGEKIVTKDVFEYNHIKKLGEICRQI